MDKYRSKKILPGSGREHTFHGHRSPPRTSQQGDLQLPQQSLGSFNPQIAGRIAERVYGINRRQWEQARRV